MSDYKDAIDYFVDDSRVFVNQNTHSAIVVHGTGGSATQTSQQLGDFFRTTPTETSVHYGVDRAGNVAQFVLEQHGAAGNCCVEDGHDAFWDQFGGDNLNVHTISIEHVNDINNSLPLTDAQKTASFKLIAYLSKKYNIASDHIKSHASIAPGSRARCPGPAYPWNDLFSYLSTGQQQEDQPMSTIDLSNPTVASHFVAAANGAWHCPSTNATIGGEILSFYQKFGNGLNGLEHIGLPLTPEIGGIPGKPGTVFQRFERAVLAYDPQKILDNPPGSDKVYLMHIDSGIGQDPRVTDLQGQVAALRSQIAALQPNALAQENTTLKSKIIQAVKVLS